MKRGARSQAVRDYLTKHPSASTKEIVDGLGAKGVKVKVALVNSIKYKKSAKSGRKGKSARTARRGASANNVTVENLLQVKHLADSLGGLDQVRGAIQMLESLQ